MIYYVDTNYFLRFFLDDNPKQAQEVRELFVRGSAEEVKLVSSLVVFLEVYWVLKSFYSFSKDQICKSLNVILRMDFIKIDEKEVIFRAMEIFDINNLDLEDCFHLAYLLENSGEAKRLATFDKKLENIYKFYSI
ncbi:hypothetical protein COW83_00605 [Candidatus Collierbacteria bacterium CG22_combo_CG10-13_8_21_14_all_43_12]|uniref:PIN domain-containing protein n=1 Tax=Candidatus Collierbacteria bacterium CG22_combo_CG10-13_8_21_14_all_43_12 TaxID=1974537 RepID=A0A2H0DVB6_9BACT|nr:MAG: hypothetical protein COW83_00605 [Candidatus Collierbacteria bacterium CG22_combo_CG10-13_8_21_14_all_43_12]